MPSINELASALLSGILEISQNNIPAEQQHQLDNLKKISSGEQLSDEAFSQTVSFIGSLACIDEDCLLRQQAILFMDAFPAAYGFKAERINNWYKLSKV